jgi:hypothetical protein
METENRIRSGRNGRLCVVVALMMFGIFFNAEAKKIYKWVDEEGVTHYGESAPPNSGTAHEIHVPKTPAVDSAVNTRNVRTERLLETYKQERTEKRETRQAATEERSEREKRCEKAKESQFKYAHASTLYRTDDDGNRVVLTDEEHAKVISDAQAKVDEWCA